MFVQLVDIADAPKNDTLGVLGPVLVQHLPGLVLPAQIGVVLPQPADPQPEPAHQARQSDDEAQNTWDQQGDQGACQSQRQTRQHQDQPEGLAAPQGRGFRQGLPDQGGVCGGLVVGLPGVHPAEDGIRRRQRQLAYGQTLFEGGLLELALELLQLGFQLLELRFGRLPVADRLPALPVLPGFGQLGFQLRQLFLSFPPLQSVQAGQGPAALVPLPIQVVELGFQLHQPALLFLRPGQLFLELLPGGFRLRQSAALVMTQGGLELFQLFVRLRIGIVLAAAGDQAAEPLFQPGIGGDGDTLLPQIAAADIDRGLHTQKLFAAASARQVLPGRAGIRIPGLKIRQRSGFAAALQGNAAAVVRCELHGADHGLAAPGQELLLVGQAVSAAPLPGVHPVEHGQQEGQPGGFAGLVVAGDEVQAGLQLQLPVLQLAEGGPHTFDDHSSGTSLPSNTARPKRSAWVTSRRASGSVSPS